MHDRQADDTALAAAAREGDLDAFEALVRAHTSAVYGHALRFFGDPTTAEDVVQEVFVKVYRSIGQFDGSAAFSTWLYRVTRNVCLDMVRAGKRRPAIADAFADVAAPGSDLGATVALSVSIETALMTLPPEDRDALSAVGLFGLSYAEASESLGVPAGTVKSRVFRARRAMAALLDIPRGGS